MTEQRRYHHSRILSMVPAEQGWRVAMTIHGLSEDAVRSGSLSDLLYEMPIACFALVERWTSYQFSELEPDEDTTLRDQDVNIEPVIAFEGSYLQSEESPDFILGPNETLQPYMRAEAIRTWESEQRAKELRRSTT